MKLEDRFAAGHVGGIDDNLAIKPTRPQQRAVEYLWAIRRCEHHDALIGLEAIHSDQQLVERLLSLVIDHAHLHATLTTHGVQFVDEYDTGRLRLGLLE